MDPVVKAAAQVIVEEIKALVEIYRVTGKLPLDRLDGLNKRIEQLEGMLK